MADLREVIKEAKLLLLSKNQDNLLQEFIWETQHLSTNGTSLPGAPVDKDTAKAHGNEALEGLRTLGTLCITNGQFRKLLSDAAILMRSMAGDAATNVAGKINPDEEALSQIDRPAEDNVWHEAPDLSKDKLKNKFNEVKPFSKKDAKEAAQEGMSTAHPDGSTDPTDLATMAAQDQAQGTSSGVNAMGGAIAAKDALMAKADTGAVNDATEKAKSKRDEVNEKTKSYLKGKMPKERREQTIWRLKKMVVEIQGHADYQKAIDTLLRLAEEYGGHSKNLTAQGTDTVKDIRSDTSVKKVETNLKTLLERFANGTSSDDFFDALNQIYTDADRDPALKGWFKKLDAYVRRCLKEPGYILQPASNDDFNHIYDEGKFFLREKYRAHTDRVLDEIKFFGNQFDEDPQNKSFAESVRALFLDLGNDENGKAAFKPHLLKDVTSVILPQFLETVHYVPLPRMEYSDPKVDFIIENLIVESDNLTPNVMEVSSDNYWKWGRKAFKNANKNSVMLAVSGVQMDMRDVSFYVNKKSGFPSLTDQGLCDIFMGGEGFSFKLKMATADATDRAHFFTIEDAKVSIKNLNIKLKQSKHKLLFAIAKPLLLRIMRPPLQKALEAAIKQKARELDAILWEIHQEANQAKKSALENPDPENIKNIYQQHWDAANSRWTRMKEKKAKLDKKVEQTKFNMAMTKQDSIFPNISLTSGISTKATEYKELAEKGDRWESPVFSIGSAGESKNIPSAPKIQRKGMGSKGLSLNGASGSSATEGLTGAPTGFGTNGTNGTNGSNGLGAPLGTNGATNGASNGLKYGTVGAQNGATGLPGVQQAGYPHGQTFDPLNA
jgi:hypothetical protein